MIFEFKPHLPLELEVPSWPHRGKALTPAARLPLLPVKKTVVESMLILRDVLSKLAMA